MDTFFPFGFRLPPLPRARIPGGEAPAGGMPPVDPTELQQIDQTGIFTSPPPSEPGHIPAFGAAGFAHGLDKFGPGVLADLAPFAMGPLAGRMMQAAPRTFAASQTALMAPGQAQGQAGKGGNAQSEAEMEATRQLQRMLKSKGYYRGPIDGNTGPATVEAQQRYQADLARDQASANEAARAQAEAEAAKAAAAKAKTDQEAIAAERAAAQQRQANKEKGDARVREIESQRPWYSTAMRDYSEPIGTVAGLMAGYGARRGIVAGSDALSRRAADRANALVRGEGDTAARVSNTNQFYTEGGGRAPFSMAPGTPHGFKPNPKVPPASDLYPPSASNPRWNSIDTGAMSVFGGDFAFATERQMAAEREVREAEAQAAAEQERDGAPAEFTLQRLNAARDRAGLWHGIGRAGLMAGVGYGGAALKGQRSPTRPNVGQGEAERMRLNEMLRPSASAPSGPSGPRTPPEGATWNAAAQRWQHRGRFVAGDPPPRGNWNPDE